MESDLPCQRRQAPWTECLRSLFCSGIDPTYGERADIFLLSTASDFLSLAKRSIRTEETQGGRMGRRQLRMFYNNGSWCQEDAYFCSIRYPDLFKPVESPTERAKLKALSVVWRMFPTRIRRPIL